MRNGEGPETGPPPFVVTDGSAVVVVLQRVQDLRRGGRDAGAAALIAGAYTGIATTPAEILNSLEHHHHG